MDPDNPNKRRRLSSAELLDIPEDGHPAPLDESGTIFAVEELLADDSNTTADDSTTTVTQPEETSAQNDARSCIESVVRDLLATIEAMEENEETSGSEAVTASSAERSTAMTMFCETPANATEGSEEPMDTLPPPPPPPMDIPPPPPPPEDAPQPLRAEALPPPPMADLLPETLKIEPFHPLQKFYQPFEGTLPTVATHKIRVQEDINKDIQFLRNQSVWAALTLGTTNPTKKGEKRGQLETISEKPSDPGVIFIITRHGGRTCLATPLHVEVCVPGRPDLFYVTFSNHSRDRKNGDNIDVNDYHEGDALYVTKLVRRPQQSFEVVPTTFDNVTDPNIHKFWGIDEFFLIERTNKVAATIRLPGQAHVVGKVECIASGIGQSVFGPKHLFPEKAGGNNKPRTKCLARIFVPRLQPGRVLATIAGPNAKSTVTEMAHSIINETHVYPWVLSAVQLSPAEQRSFDSLPNVFTTFRPGDNHGYNALLSGTLLAFSGVLAAGNRDKDLRVYLTTIQHVHTVRGKPVVTFAIQGVTGPPSLQLWPRGARIRVDAPEHLVEMELESAANEAEFVVITARPTTSKEEILNFVSDLKNRKLMVYQKFEKHDYQFRTFPRQDAYQTIPRTAPIKLLLEAILGGPRIPDQPIPDRNFDFTLDGVRPSDEQRQYLSALLHTEIPVIQANSPFGVGKTLMIVMALVKLADRDRCSEAIHAATTTTNTATVAIAETLIRVAGSYNLRALRVISATNHGTVDDKQKTEIDFPTLWPRVFRKHAEQADERMERCDEIDALSTSVLAHLQNNDQLHGMEFRSSKIRKFLTQRQSPALSLWDAFLQLYRPHIILGTSATLTEAFSHPHPLSTLSTFVATIQVDEASQFAMHALISLGPHCPKARYALIGDINQLEPYADVQLLEEMKTIAVGNLLKKATGRVQAVNLTRVFRCPPEITNICSDLFYRQGLRAQRNPILDHPYHTILRFRDRFAIQVVHTQGLHTRSGTSLYHADEARMASQMVTAIRNQEPDADIGVLAFYKAQAGYISKMPQFNNVFIGTIDASQGKEFEVTFILVSRSNAFRTPQPAEAPQVSRRQKRRMRPANDATDFIEDTRRINVALSRTKRLCVLLVHEESARTSDIWSRLLDRVPRAATHNGWRINI
ncbi:hypothetical protein CAEBREN_23506 [Caenorhabditis brenneri]|uniref:Uncharacterized protein n=1 Tax=Caenorhabditis brenneri TaxID=135651 RepID=G0P8F2_CAEBE|nr:hypothetical protein CAEBREN_23506 [Caenorhabditis brenneri]